MNWAVFFEVLGFCAAACVFAAASIAFINWAVDRGLPGIVAIGVPAAAIFLTAATLAGALA